MNYVEENFMHLLDNLSDQIKILRMLKKNIEKKNNLPIPGIEPGLPKKCKIIVFDNVISSNDLRERKFYKLN